MSQPKKRPSKTCLDRLDQRIRDFELLLERMRQAESQYTDRTIEVCEEALRVYRRYRNQSIDPYPRTFTKRLAYLGECYVQLELSKRNVKAQKMTLGVISGRKEYE